MESQPMPSRDLPTPISESLCPPGSQLAEVRWEEVATERIVGSAGPAGLRVLPPARLLDRGAAYRVWINGRLGTAHGPQASITPALVGKGLALAVAQASAGPKAGFLPSLPCLTYRGVNELATRPGLSPVELAEWLGHLLTENRRSVGELVLQLRKTRRRRVVANSRGGHVETDEAWVSLDITVHVSGGTLNRGLGTTAALSDLAECGPVIDSLWKAVSAPRRPISAGRYRVVMDPEITGLLVHEVLGHAAEADVLASQGDGGWLRPGQAVTSPEISVYDDPTPAGPYGHYTHDDEGVRATRVNLVVSGVFQSPLHSCTTAAMAGQPPTGHGRAVNWRHPPIVRMATTLMAAGAMSLEELLEATWDGLYLGGARGGAGGNPFHVCAGDAWVIKRGRLASRVGPVRGSGDLSMVLMDIIGLGASVSVLGGGEGGCGKNGQFPLPVASGGPALGVTALDVTG